MTAFACTAVRTPASKLITNDAEMISHFLRLKGVRAFLTSLREIHFLLSLCYSNVLSCGENARTSHGIARVWPSPGKEPRKDVMSAILISIHHESTLSTAIRSLVERHRLFMPTATTHF